jgi:glycosyltransferase involved in cell wall biosynthesis
MKIAIESFWLNTKELTGVGYYIFNTLKEINRIAPDNTYYLLYTGEKWVGPDLGNNFIPVCYGKGKVTIAIWFNLHKIIKKLAPDMYHAPFPTRVPPQKLPCLVVTTVHDLLALHIKGFSKKLLFNLTTHWAWKNSDHFLCNSNYTANEIVKYKNIPGEKITVTYLAPAHEIGRWNPPGKHLLFVGSLTSRKNPLFLVDVYYSLCKILHDPPPLIFIGEDRENNGQKILRAAAKCPSNGKFSWFKYIKQKELSVLFSDAAAVILPSKLEGFGMPVIEAMSGGVPVVCSDIDIFKEIAPVGALKVNGWDVDTWADSIKNLLDNNSLKYKLSEEAVAQSSNFTWENCAKQTFKTYRNVVTNGN